MDLVRVTRYDGSVSLYVPLRSIRAYQAGVKRSPPCFLTGGLQCLNLTVCGGVGAASGLAVRLLAKARSSNTGL